MTSVCEFRMRCVDLLSEAVCRGAMCFSDECFSLCYLGQWISRCCVVFGARGCGTVYTLQGRLRLYGAKREREREFLSLSLTLSLMALKYV